MKGTTNKDTEAAGLKFNVNTVKRKLTAFYEKEEIATPTYTGGPTAITAVLQKVYELILKESLKRLPGDGKDKSGCKTINGQIVQYAIVLHSSFEQYFLAQLKHYDEKQMYKDQIPVSVADMDKLRDSVDDKINLTPKANNLVCYLLMKVFLDLAQTSSQLLEFSGKKSMSAKCVMSSVSIKFSDDIASILRSEISRAAKVADEDVEGANEGGQEDVVASVDVETTVIDDSNEPEETQTTQTTTNTKSTKKATTSTTSNKSTSGSGGSGGNKSTKKAQTIDAEEDAEAEVQIESAEDEEVTATTPAPKSTKSTKTTTTTPTKTTKSATSTKTTKSASTKSSK